MTEPRKGNGDQQYLTGKNMQNKSNRIPRKLMKRPEAGDKRQSDYRKEQVVGRRGYKFHFRQKNPAKQKEKARQIQKRLDESVKKLDRL